jgi:hypothetical protein
MTPELIQAWASIINAAALPLTTLIIVILLRSFILPAITMGRGISLKAKDFFEFSVEPTQVLRSPSSKAPGDRPQSKDVEQTSKDSTTKIPFDYYFLNHTSFLRTDKQAEYRQRTGVNLNHYDIRVIVDSYYRGALDRIDRVEYILHSAYPNPIQYRRSPEDKFLLKELANGEYVLMAKVFLKDREEPILLQRYITLWESGPRLP